MPFAFKISAHNPFAAEVVSFFNATNDDINIVIDAFIHRANQQNNLSALIDLYHERQALFDQRNISKFLFVLNRIYAATKMTLGMNHLLVLKKLTERIKKEINQYTPEQLTDIVRAYIFLNAADERFLDLLAEACLKKIDQFKQMPKKLVSILFSFVLSGKKYHTLLSQGASSVSSHLKRYSAGDLADLYWAYNVFDLNQWVESVGYYIFYQTQPQDYRPQALLKIYHATLISDIEIPDHFQSAINVVLTQMQAHTEITSSKFHKKIESLLLKQQLKFESEYFLDGFRLDLAIPEFGIAIEPAGRVFHYNANGYEKAKDIIRSKILKKLGWRVFNIDSSNWAKMNLEKQEQFIKQLSKQVRDLMQ